MNLRSTTLDQLLNYFKAPHFTKNARINWTFFFKSLLMLLIICLPLEIINFYLLKGAHLSPINLGSGKFELFIMALLLAPLLEEPFFRLILKPTFNSFLVITILLGLMGFTCLIQKAFILSLIFLFLMCFLLVLLGNKIRFRNSQIFLIRNFPYFFYSSCILFGIVHITNYQPFSYKVLLIVPVFSIPYIIAGMFLGYIRMKFGLWYSMLFHSGINFIPALLMLFSK